MIDRVTSHLPYWLWPGDNRSPQAIDDDIAAELQLHVALLAEEHQRQGMPAEEALAAAARRFGDIDKVARQCRRVKQGDAAMMQRFLAAVCVLLVIAVGSLIWQSSRMAAKQQALLDRLDAMRAAMAKARDENAKADGGPVELGRVSGVVQSRFGGEPIAGARVLAVFKTWPGGTYTQEGRTTVTDAEGRFTFLDAVPLNRQRGIQLAIFADGYAFQSSYEFTERPIGQPVHPRHFSLTSAKPVQLVFPNGEQGVSIRPKERHSKFEGSHLVYSEGVELVEVTTEVVSEDGGRRVTGLTIPWLAAGDTAKVIVKGQFGPEEQYLEISADGVVSLPESQALKTYRLATEDSL